MEPIRIEITVRLEPCEKLISVLRDALLHPEIEKPSQEEIKTQRLDKRPQESKNIKQGEHGLKGIRPKVAKEKTCTVCGKKYQPTSNVQRFCLNCKALKKLYGKEAFKKHVQNRDKVEEPIEKTLAEIEQARIKREQEAYQFGK